LRPWSINDAELRFVTSLDSETLSLHEDGITLPTSVELQRERLEKIAGFKDENMIRLAMDTFAGVTVGWVTLHTRDQKNGTFGFGVAIYREHRGQGYAVDGVRLILKYAFWEQRFQKCNSMCFAINQGSIRLHQKLGFVEEGRIRRNCFFGGKYHDDVLFGMTREEFDAGMKS
jgi:RimJ/RimL family protein N-acetyltransferase